jgi:hypothetical protein
VKILYHLPNPDTIYAARFIFEGYRNACVNEGHSFRALTASDNLADVLEEFRPDILTTSLNGFNLKYLDLDLLKRYRDKGLVVFVQISPWRKQCSQFGAGGLEEMPDRVKLIRSGKVGDIFHHWMEQDDPFMDGFVKGTGKPFETVLLAADTKRFYPDFDEQYEGDVCFIGSCLPDKRKTLGQWVVPLRARYRTRIYGNDWTLGNRLLGYVQKGGQFFNIPYLKSLRKVMLPLEDERKVYASSVVSLNIHEEHQRAYGSDFNERTFKIIASGGFEICDDVRTLRRYFTEDELVIGRNLDDWFDKIDHYIRNPEERLPIIEAGRQKVLSGHTYEHRVRQIVGLASAFRGESAETSATGEAR